MKENDDMLLRQFMQQQKQDIPDKGFSRRVLQHLSKRENQLSAIWACICIIMGGLCFYLFNGTTALKEYVQTILPLITQCDMSVINSTSIIFPLIILMVLGIQRIANIE